MKYAILVTGQNSGVGQGIVRVLRSVSEDNPYYIVGADPNPAAAGLFECDNKAFLPMAKDEEAYIDTLFFVINKHNISLVFPGSDPEVFVLSKYKKEIEKKTRAIVAVGDHQTVGLCMDKLLLPEILTTIDNSIQMPHSVPIQSKEAKDFPLPCIIKPRNGSGSTDVFVFQKKKGVDAAKRRFIDQYRRRRWVVQDYIEGEEYTASVILDLKGNVVDSMVLSRDPKLGPKHAFVSRKVSDHPQLRHFAEKVAQRINLPGIVNIQFRDSVDANSKWSAKGPVVFEINPRFPGSTPLCAAAGMNGPHIVAQMLLTGKIPEIKPHNRKMAAAYRMHEVFYET